tara:strand:- start:13233 stop:13406 length:174 start_codon:yes stop_codon:yes gene_type:complete
MSGDFFTHNDQQPPLPCKASAAMDEIKESRWHNTNYVLEIESMFINARYKTGSPMQD